MGEVPLTLRVIGYVESTLTDPEAAPRQPDEGAPAAWLVIDPAFVGGLDGLATGTDVVVLTWLDRADRDVLAVHPRGDVSRRPQGVFATRAPDRPNPIGLHDCVVTAVEGNRVGVAHLEAIDGTPIVDLKPALGPIASR